MSLKNLTNLWSLPDRSGERAQITLRLSFNEYARLHALKEIFDRPVNDMLNDLIRASLDEIIDTLPSYRISAEQAIDLAGCPGYPDDPSLIQGCIGGLRADFDAAYARILNGKSSCQPMEVDL